MVMSEHEDDAEEVSGQGGEDDILAGDEADDLQARLEEAEREREQFKSMAARAQADLVNYRRRAEEEKEEIQRSAKSALLMKTLSTVDDLDRAIAMMPTDESAGWAEGIQLVRRNVVNMLDTEGVTKVESLGKALRPRLRRGPPVPGDRGRRRGNGRRGLQGRIYVQGSGAPGRAGRGCQASRAAGNR